MESDLSYISRQPGSVVYMRVLGGASTPHKAANAVDLATAPQATFARDYRVDGMERLAQVKQCLDLYF
jgi:hypothetical protein